MIYWLRADAYDTLGTFMSQRKGKIQTSTTNLVFHACSGACSSSLIFFFTETQPGKFCVLSLLSCAKATACYPSLKTKNNTWSDSQLL